MKNIYLNIKINNKKELIIKIALKLSSKPILVY